MTASIRTASVKQGLQGTDSNSQESGPRRASADYNWLNHDLQCSLVVCSFVCMSVHSVYVVTPQPTPCGPLHIHQIDINIHEEAGGHHPKMRVLMNEANVHVSVYAWVCVCVFHRCRGPNCNQIPTAPSSPPSSTTSGAPSLHSNANMWCHMPACGPAQADAACWIMARDQPR